MPASVWRRVLVGVALLLASAVAAFAIFQPVKVLPRLEPAPPFRLLDASGRDVSVSDLPSGITLYSFFPTRGAHAPATVQSLQRWRQAVERDRELAGQVQFVTISLDPEHDSPAILAAFAAQHGLPSDWRLLTGSWVAVKLAVGSGFGIFYEHAGAPAAEPVRYEPGFRLVDAAGVVRARYSGVELPAERALRDVRLLVQEARATGAGRWLNEAAHLFLCFPK